VIAAPLARNALVLLSLAALGCGGATAPCPTPTTEIDSARAESEQLEGEIAREAARQRALAARRAVAALAVEEIQAALDSLGGATGR